LPLRFGLWGYRTKPPHYPVPFLGRHGNHTFLSFRRLLRDLSRRIDGDVAVIHGLDEFGRAVVHHFAGLSRGFLVAESSDFRGAANINKILLMSKISARALGFATDSSLYRNPLAGRKILPQLILIVFAAGDALDIDGSGWDFLNTDQAAGPKTTLAKDELA